MYILLGPTKTYSSKDVPWILFMIKKNWKQQPKHTWRKNSLSYDNHRILCTHVNQPESWEVLGCLIKCHKSSRKIQSGRGGHGWAGPLKNNGMTPLCLLCEGQGGGDRVLGTNSEKRFHIPRRDDLHALGWRVGCLWLALWPPLLPRVEKPASQGRSHAPMLTDGHWGPSICMETGQPLGRVFSPGPNSGPDTHKVYLLDWPHLRSTGCLGPGFGLESTLGVLKDMGHQASKPRATRWSGKRQHKKCPGHRRISQGSLRDQTDWPRGS